MVGGSSGNDRTVLPLGCEYKVGEHLIGWFGGSSGNDRTVLPLGCEYKVGEHLIGWGWGV